jgi:hypothetical protein
LWKEVVMDQFEVLFRHLPERTEEIHGNLSQHIWCSDRDSNLSSPNTCKKSDRFSEPDQHNWIVVWWWLYCGRYIRVIIFGDGNIWAHFWILELEIAIYNATFSRSQWPLCIGHEMSFPAPTLGSWIRTSFETSMYVYAFSVFVLSCVGSGLGTGWPSVQGVLQTL